MKKMYRKRRRRKRLSKTERERKLLLATAILVGCVLLLAICIISASNSALEDVGDTEDMYMTEEEDKGTSENIDGETGEVYQTALPENMSYNDALSSDVEYSFELTNEELLSGNGFTEEQIKVSKVLLEQYIQSNISGISLNNVQAVEDTVYSCNGYFGVVFCLNEDSLEYAQITGNGTDVKCLENMYAVPAKQYGTDLADETDEHGQYEMLYDGKFSEVMDSEDFPYTEQHVEAFITGYYKDLSEKNAYENYLNYFLPMTEYMIREWSSFNCQFSTFQSSVSQLRELLADGDNSLLEKGKFSASVTGYRQYSYTVVTARVNVTLADGSNKNTRTEYVTVGYNNGSLFILPHDLYTMQYWRYMYLY